MPDGQRLVLVVGPSGAGKDSVIRGAQQALAGRTDIVFPRRVITRPADTTGGEDHEPCEPAAFERRAAAGDFTLHWHANGLRYGVPATIEADLTAGRAVVVNVSRAIIPAAEMRYPDLSVCVITASPAVLAARLRQRGRESADDIVARLGRADAFTVSARRVRTINNDGPLAASVDALLEAIDFGPRASTRASAR
ncbi:phosphonate metabolism protein/1,5-bisphosphokinase (PRPP-forming) PhnN [Reyranella sp. CPCC 100927]|uniref:phosphonate metabolism protein/1,5-bisphosphokinase (PRPP-forming) PhnN n=1 Tax=Reyranella sp. CPCC 100927 TaxID=2599616 RepID=UPI0011B7BCE9|nr:phosphonate metabolism protein/1,5-bisphosphokinase (PRPP-forming) PhnN [Reyranella sp. CPCC 100927]TWS95142.1 phosphonate metabolism protein/1,5-bisphosphokinase (PRPP-forming) PhnN [Reyranella sp. CPCC 100927]